MGCHSSEGVGERIRWGSYSSEMWGCIIRWGVILRTGWVGRIRWGVAVRRGWGSRIRWWSYASEEWSGRIRWGFSLWMGGVIRWGSCFRRPGLAGYGGGVTLWIGWSGKIRRGCYSLDWWDVSVRWGSYSWEGCGGRMRWGCTLLRGWSGRFEKGMWWVTLLTEAKATVSCSKMKHTNILHNPDRSLETSPPNLWLLELAALETGSSLEVELCH